ncbi:MAG: hypothetical protein J5691_01630 [Bacilli bacterium]|nr:hypothetical protein [Bacilli bacterium]
MKYTFKVLGKDNKVYYPKQFAWEKENAEPGVGALDFEWTENINEAKTWDYKNICEDIAFEFVDATIVEIPTSEITITNANNQEKFICFKINGLKDGIMVGLYPNNDGLSIAYRGDVVGVPFNANSALIDELNDRSFPEPDEITGTIKMSKETYDWLTTPSEEDDDVGYWQPDQVTELDDEAFDEFEKDVMNPEIDEKRVEAAKQIFEGVDKIPIDTSDLWKHELTYGKPHLLELMDEWGVDGTNYADFRSVIQEHCFDKGLYAFDDIEKTWKSHVQSLKDVVKSIKEGIK